MNEFVAIVMGSKSDFGFAKKIGETLEKFGVGYEYRIASAHKATEYALDLVRQYDSSDKSVVYIAVAGRSNALCGVLDANTTRPVITCPPYSDKFGGGDIYSSLRMPSGVACTVIIDPKAAALAAAKIFSLSNPEIKKNIEEYKKAFTESIKSDDEEFKGKKVSELE